jgi:hypothetical protein
MNPSIFGLDNFFDARAILNCIPSEILNDPEFTIHHQQISITHSITDDSFYSSVGSLYDLDRKNFANRTSEFIILNKVFKGTYMEQVINEVTEVAKNANVKIGRVRLMMISQKKCYSLHKDFEEFRYHIPLITNDKCFFVVGDTVGRMPVEGQLYRFNTRQEHTAVNASLSTRIHLLFDTY